MHFYTFVTTNVSYRNVICNTDKFVIKIMLSAIPQCCGSTDERHMVPLTEAVVNKQYT